MSFLILNIGSSSVKFQVIDIEKKSWTFRGKIDHLSKKFVAYTIKKKISLPCPDSNIEKNMELMAQIMNKEKILGIAQKTKQSRAQEEEREAVKKFTPIQAIVHRVVHGGKKYHDPVLLNKKIIRELKKLGELAPLHNPYNLEGIQAAQKIFPHFPHIAVFDTGFYKTLPEKAFLYAVPLQWYRKFAVRKYGFHGISHEYVTQETLRRLKIGERKGREDLALPVLRRASLSIKIVTCHLGAGCSITASINGKAVDTSMGFTPLEGVPMATRSGDIDPAVIPCLMKKLKCTAKEVIKKLNKESGLKGLSNISDDMRILHQKAEKGHAQSKLAIEIFCYAVAKYIGSYAAAMNGLDAITFTGGIGENAKYIQKKITSYLKFLKPQPKNFTIKTNEELAMALMTKKILRK